MSEKPDITTPDAVSNQAAENTRCVLIGNTTFEIVSYHSGDCTYEDIVVRAIKRVAKSG